MGDGSPVTGGPRQSWDRIRSWLGTHAPGTLAALLPPSGAASAAHEPDWPQPLPADLVTFFSVQGGVGGASALDGLILPSHYPLSLAEAVGDWSIKVPTSSTGRVPQVSEHARGPAGSFARTWVEAFVPISRDGAGNAYFVDLRSGDRRGCVNRFDHEEGALQQPIWDSVTAMLKDVAEALEQGRPSAGWQPEVTTNGTLSWYPADDA